VVGVAAGTAVAGAVVEAAGWRDAVLCGAAAGVVGSVVAVARRGTLRPAT
jgi:predicted MFS family arabinose efflux permease